MPLGAWGSLTRVGGGSSKACLWLRSPLLRVVGAHHLFRELPSRVGFPHAMRGAESFRGLCARIQLYLKHTQLLPMDILALATMKNAAKCDT